MIEKCMSEVDVSKVDIHKYSAKFPRLLAASGQRWRQFCHCVMLWRHTVNVDTFQLSLDGS